MGLQARPVIPSVLITLNPKNSKTCGVWERKRGLDTLLLPAVSHDADRVVLTQLSARNY